MHGDKAVWNSLILGRLPKSLPMASGPNCLRHAGKWLGVVLPFGLYCRPSSLCVFAWKPHRRSRSRGTDGLVVEHSQRESLPASSARFGRGGWARAIPEPTNQ